MARTERRAQLAYSELMSAMTDEEKRRTKAAKILAVLRHFLGRTDLTGLTVLDVGSSAGFIADELAAAGGRVIGADIDVPGLRSAADRFGHRVGFLCTSADALPLPDESVDVAVLNHIYEHVVDPDAVVAELRRVLKPEGVLYLGLGNRLGVMEPHYRLPFLSYLPPAAADRYVRAFGRADHYHERFRTRPGLRRMMGAWKVWDYTLPVLRAPEAFAAGDMVSGPAARVLARVPEKALRLTLPGVPTYVWVATKAGEPAPSATTGRPDSPARVH